MPTTTTTRITRDLDEAMLGGVMSGVAARYEWDPTLLRIVAALVTLSTGVVPGVLIYLAAWVIIPRADTLAAEAAEVTATTPEPATPEATPSAGSAEPPPGVEEDAPSEPDDAGAATAVADEIAGALRDAADRLGQAATIAADAARQAANEIGEVARRPRAVAVQERPDDEPSQPETPADGLVSDEPADAPDAADSDVSDREPGA